MYDFFTVKELVYHQCHGDLRALHKSVDSKSGFRLSERMRDKKDKKPQPGALGYDGATMLCGIDWGWILSGLAMS